MGESRAGLSSRSEIAWKNKERKVAWICIVFKGGAKVSNPTQQRLATPAWFEPSCSAKRGARGLSHHLPHIWGWKRGGWGIEVVSIQTSKMGSDSLLQFTPMFDWWLKCNNFYLIAFELTGVRHCGALWLRPEARKGDESSLACVPWHCMGTEMVSSCFLLVSGMKQLSTDRNIFRNLTELVGGVLALCVGQLFIPFCRLFCEYLYVLN